MRSLKAYLWLLAVLALSGLFLMFLYVPSVATPLPAAAGNGRPIGYTTGYIVRGAHFWAGNLVVLAALAQLDRTIFVKTNRRGAAWMAALILLTLGSCFTGYLLPWDQLPFWMQQSWLPNISAQDSLWTVYWIHTLVLSLLILPLLFFYVRRMNRDSAKPA